MFADSSDDTIDSPDGSKIDESFEGVDPEQAVFEAAFTDLGVAL
jgi:hypothetical protein